MSSALTLPDDAPGPVFPTGNTFPSLRPASSGRLRMIDRRAIVLHLHGRTGSEIEKALGKGPGWMSQVLRRPGVRTLLADAYRDYDDELKALTPAAIDTIRAYLQSPDGNIALRAVELQFKATGRYKESENAQLTAEDVVERILERVSPSGDTVRATERRIIRSVVRNPNPPGGSAADSSTT